MSAIEKQSLLPGAPAAVHCREAEVQQQYLTFNVGGEMFALGIMSIREIIPYGNLTQIPMTPASIRGVINLRGAVVPVVDLAVRFGGKAKETTKRTCIVIIEIDAGEGSRDVGVVVDGVSEVRDIPASEIGPPPDFGARIPIDFIHGMGRVGGSLMAILDAERMLSLEEIATVARTAYVEAEGA